MALLIQYQDARKNVDLDRYLGCLHEQGTFHHASRVTPLKNKLSEALPSFWNQLQEGNRSFFPMCRESLSGNYFVRFYLVNPIISINQNSASATLTYVNKGWRQKHYISVIKENKRRLISRLDWETG